MNTRPHEVKTDKKQSHSSRKQPVFIKTGNLFTDTQIIARVIGRKHNQVLSVVESVFEDYPDFRGRATSPKICGIEPVFIAEVREYRSEEFTAYLLNESAFNLILPRFKTRKALDAFLQLITTFQKMKTALIQADANRENLLFQELRLDGKKTRHSLTDALKVFGEYSKGQGSTGSGYLYNNITKQVYKGLGIEVRKGQSVRDSLATVELGKLVALEQLVCKELYGGMDAGLCYKRIKASLKKVIGQCDKFGGV